jgi:hypothetical protein
MSAPVDWVARLEAALAALAASDPDAEAYLSANADLVLRALTGQGVDGGVAPGGVGAKVVVNMSAAHVPAFITDGYKNAYDLDAEAARVGEKPAVSAKRLAVDTALQSVHGDAPKDIYFAAIELNGCGVGFYGDLCLVLRDDVTERGDVVLDRNSYDLIREPLRSRIETAAGGGDPGPARAQQAAQMAGTLNRDAQAIAAIKVLQGRPPVQRLMSTGMVSEGVLEDEDYIEVLRPGGFAVGDLAEVRLTSAEVALDERIGSRALTGRPPSQAELLWRDNRRRAEDRLRALGVPVRVVTAAGRTKG